MNTQRPAERTLEQHFAAALADTGPAAEPVVVHWAIWMDILRERIADAANAHPLTQHDLF